VRDGDENVDKGEGDAPRSEDWLGNLGAGAIAAMGAGVFALSILGMIAIDRIGGALTAGAAPVRIVAPEVEGVAFEMPATDLAVVASRGRAPAWRLHGAAFEAPADRPLMAIVVLDDGTRSDAAMGALDWDAPLSFAIAADFDLSPHRIERVRRAGREALALVPFGYGPDLGGDPNVLRRGLGEAELLRRLRWHLARAGDGIVGVVDHHAGDLVRDVDMLRIVGGGLVDEGMLTIDSRGDARSLLSASLRPMGVPVGRGRARIGRDDARDAVFEKLADADQYARTWGTAIVTVEAGEETMASLAAWIQARGQDVLLAPVSHVVRRLRRGPQATDD